MCAAPRECLVCDDVMVVMEGALSLSQITTQTSLWESEGRVLKNQAACTMAKVSLFLLLCAAKH